MLQFQTLEQMLGVETEGHMLFLRRLHAYHARAFAVLDAAIRLGDEFVDATHGTTGSGDVEKVLRILFGRMYNTLTATATLLKLGYGVEAGMLTRAFLESFFNVCYIASAAEADRAKLARRFLDYQWVAQYLNLRNLAKAEAKLPKGALRRAKQEWKDNWVNKYGWDDIRNQLDWSGLKLEEKAHAGNVTPVYKWLNRHFSEMVHGGPDAWQHYVLEKEEKIQFIVGPNDNALIDFPIPALGHLFGIAVQLLAQVFELPVLVARGEETINLVRRVFKEAEADAP